MVLSNSLLLLTITVYSSELLIQYQFFFYYDFTVHAHLSSGDGGISFESLFPAMSSMYSVSNLPSPTTVVTSTSSYSEFSMQTHITSTSSSSSVEPTSSISQLKSALILYVTIPPLCLVVLIVIIVAIVSEQFGLHRNTLYNVPYHC